MARPKRVYPSSLHKFDKMLTRKIKMRAGNTKTLLT
jgi:hypothetical protein